MWDSFDYNEESTFIVGSIYHKNTNYDNSLYSKNTGNWDDVEKLKQGQRGAHR